MLLIGDARFRGVLRDGVYAFILLFKSVPLQVLLVVLRLPFVLVARLLCRGRLTNVLLFYGGVL